LLQCDKWDKKIYRSETVGFFVCIDSKKKKLSFDETQEVIKYLRDLDEYDKQINDIREKYGYGFGEYPFP